MFKRITALLLILVLAAGLAACGGKEPESKAPAEAPKPAVTTATEPVAPEPEPEPEPADPFADRETVDLAFFQLAYPDGWYFDEEEDVSTGLTWSNIMLFDNEDWEIAENEVHINADVQEARAYRKDLYDLGVDLEACAAGDMESVTIDGVDFLVCRDAANAEKTRFFYRHAPSGVTYSGAVFGDFDAESVQDLLAGVQLNLTDDGKVDPPWPWEGAPFQPTLTPQMAGTFTITPEAVPFEAPKWVMETMEHRFCQQGDQLFHLLGDTLDTYSYAPEGLTLISSAQLEDDYEYITAGSDGMLFLSEGVFEVIGVKDGQKAMETTVAHDLVMHPSGAWGLTFWVNADVQKVTVQDGVLTEEPWVLTGLDDDEARQGPFTAISEMEITDSHVLVAGSIQTEEDGSERIVVYDLNGAPLLTLGSGTLGDPDLLGHVTAMAETANGFVAADGNMRGLYFWSKDGTFLGAINVCDLVGADYPWLEDMQLLEDGSLLLMLTDERADESSEELSVFRLTGF